MATIEKSGAELLKAQAHIWIQTYSFMKSASLKCALQLGIPDVIQNHGKPMSLSELTASLPINHSKAHCIRRLMRILVKSGFFVEETSWSCDGERDETSYALTPVSRLLLKDEPLNARAHVLMSLDPERLKPWNVLTEWFQNNDSTPFVTAHGRNFWDYNVEEPRTEKMFNEAMVSDSKLIAQVLISECTFVFEGLTSLVDVGGGTGNVAKAIAKKFPNLKCTVFDLPHVVSGLEGTDENLEFVAGDMFENIPQAQAILLKWILHDWSDEDCIKILKNCKMGIPGKGNGGKLIIIDMVTESQNKLDNESVEVQICFDILMPVLFGAKERTEKEWATLFRDAGFSSYKVFQKLGSRSIIEVHP